MDARKSISRRSIFKLLGIGAVGLIVPKTFISMYVSKPVIHPGEAIMLELMELVGKPSSDTVCISIPDKAWNQVWDYLRSSEPDPYYGSGFRYLRVKSVPILNNKYCHSVIDC